MSSDPKRDLAALRQLTEHLSDGRPLEDALHAVTDASLVLLPGDHASIRLVDASSTQLLSGARSGTGKTGIAHAGQRILAWHKRRLGRNEHRLSQHLAEMMSADRFWQEV